MSTETAPAQVTPIQNTLSVLSTSFSDIFTLFGNVNSSTRDIHTQVKALQRTVRRERAKLSKNRRKKNNTKIHMPMTITKELAKFLGVNATTLISKKDVMGLVSKYVKDNNLQITSNKRQFKPNTKLRKLFGLKKSVPMTFVEINKHISHHFSEPISVTVEEATS